MWIMTKYWVDYETYLVLSLFNWSIWSPISTTASLCFLRKLAKVASCWMLASSRSRRSLLISASRFLFSSIWAEVAPPASSRRSPNSSSSRARSARCFSAYSVVEQNTRNLLYCTKTQQNDWNRQENQSNRIIPWHELVFRLRLPLRVLRFSTETQNRWYYTYKHYSESTLIESYTYNTYLKFLDLFLLFADQRLFVFQLSRERSQFFVFPLDCLF